jgi:hypothetical protein
MSLNPLIIGEKQKQALQELRERASLNTIDVRKVLTLSGVALEAYRERMLTDYSVEIPEAYRVTYSIETNHPAGNCRHMSISSRRSGRTPTPAAVWLIALELGFIGNLDLCKIWTEDIGRLPDGRQQIAINLVQPLMIEGKMHHA